MTIEIHQYLALEKSADETLSAAHFGRYTGIYLKHIDRRAKSHCLVAIAYRVDFLCESTRGIGHNRKRAKFARQLKRQPATPEQCDRVLNSVLSKLETGDIDQQFIDQIRCALFINRDKVRRKAELLLNSPKDLIKKYAQITLSLGVSSLQKNCLKANEIGDQ